MVVDDWDYEPFFASDALQMSSKLGMLVDGVADMVVVRDGG